MTRKERMILAIEHKTTDIVPYAIDFTLQEHEIVAKYLNDPDFEKKIRTHYTQEYFSGDPEEMPEKSGYFKDIFGVEWNRNGADKDIGMIEKAVVDEFNYKSYVFPDVDKKDIKNRFEKFLANNNDTFKFGTIGFSMFERAWSLMGLENTLMYMVSDPHIVHEMLDKICAYNMEMLDVILEFDIDGFFFGDDWGQQKGLIMGPHYWREFIKPRMKVLYERVKKSGKKLMQHSCGDILEIFPDLIDMGLDIYQTFQPEIYDIEKVKKEFGNNLAFCGGISTQTLLPVATPQKVKDETKRIMEIMSKDGGYIVAPTHSVPGDVPPENIMAFLEVVENQ